MEEEKISFAFGDPEVVRSEHILDYLGTFANGSGEYYSPPISFKELAKMRRANCQHGSCVLLRRNMAANAYVGGGLSIKDFRGAVTDLISLGNAFLTYQYNRMGKIIGLKHIPAINMRIRTFNKGYRRLFSGGKYIDFASNEIIHLAEYDEIQQIYGIPDWLGGIQSALLNEEATLFRRRYYVNGAHLGFILYTNDPKMPPEIRQAIEEKFKAGKGIGNFKSSYINIPGGGEKAIQIIPVGDISHKDEFSTIKNLSATDVLTAHRVPPVLMGIIPQGTASLGDPEKVERVYIRTEIKSLCQSFLDVNELLSPNLKMRFNFNVKEEE